MGSRPALKTGNFDMDSLFGLNQGGTQSSLIDPSTPCPDATPQTAGQDFDALSLFDQPEERQVFNGPSHDYKQYKQQVGLPLGSIYNMPMQPQMIDGFNSGIDMSTDGGFHDSWSSGIDMDADMGMDFNQPQQAATLPSMFFPTDGASDNFVNPTTLSGQEVPSSSGRLYPGVHAQQAQQVAMQKAAQAQAMQQRQMRLQTQQQQYRQAANVAQSHSQDSSPQQQGHGNSKRPSHVTEPHVEESISRLLNQMRNNGTAPSDDPGSPDYFLPQIARIKKDEEVMDEDERLLASEEGKRLSSKERRQLRNKVSARAFRSRRKEYVGQLEGEIALKTQEATNLRSENTRVLQENECYRSLLEILLRHPAFTPFINDISADPPALDISQLQQKPAAQSAPAPPQQTQQPQQAPVEPQPQPTQEDVKPGFLKFDASQLQIPQQQSRSATPQQQQQQQGNERAGLVMIPENDSSKLKLNPNNLQQHMSFNCQSVNAFPITSMPMGPDPADLLASCSASSAATTAFTNDFLDMNILLARLDNSARKINVQ